MSVVVCGLTKDCWFFIFDMSEVAIRPFTQTIDEVWACDTPEVTRRSKHDLFFVVEFNSMHIDREYRKDQSNIELADNIFSPCQPFWISCDVKMIIGFIFA